MNQFFSVFLLFIFIFQSTTTDAGTITQNDIQLRKQSININSSIYNKPSNDTEYSPATVTEIIIALKSSADSHSGISPSFIGLEEYKDFSYLEHAAVTALAYTATNNNQNAERILDYISKPLKQELNIIERNADSNKIFGSIKLYTDRSTATNHKGLLNGISISDISSKGRGISEFYINPASISFVIYAMLQTNIVKYKDLALELGELLVSIQNQSTGAISSTGKHKSQINTEPHIDSFAALLMLYKATGDPKWNTAANNAYLWFSSHVLNSTEAKIYQGYWNKKANTIFTTDSYARTMAGPAGDKIQLPLLKNLTDRMLKQSLVQISLPLPNSPQKNLVLADFYDPINESIINHRKEFYPIGSIENTAAVILALQKNAVRFHKANNSTTARLYKALATILQRNLMNCFYKMNGSAGKIAFYSTAQGMPIAPFGADESAINANKNYPYFYANPKDFSQDPIIAGSSVGSWAILTQSLFNPFIRNDLYKNDYANIVCEKQDFSTAKIFIAAIIQNRNRIESFTDLSLTEHIINEPGEYTKRMWAFFNKAEQAKANNKFYEMRRAYTHAMDWANKAIQAPTWFSQAMQDNRIKAKEVNGIINYPWGKTFKNNDHALHHEILRYPLLNEMGAAAWALATINYELGNYSDTKHWIKLIINEIPLHQIPAISNTENGDLIIGYWNALTVWEDNPRNNLRDRKMHEVYMEVLSELGLSSAKPQKVDF